MGVKNTTTAKRIQEDTTEVSQIAIFDSITYNKSRRVGVDGDSIGVLQTVENRHVGFLMEKNSGGL